MPAPRESKGRNIPKVNYVGMAGIEDEPKRKSKGKKSVKAEVIEEVEWEDAEEVEDLVILNIH